MIVHLPQLAWHGCKEFQAYFPDTWQIEACHMSGYDRPPLSSEAIRSAILEPIDKPPIRETARNKQQVAIIFDDMARATRVFEIAPFVIEELEKAGIHDGQIRFISALGCHGPMTRPDFIKKLGKPVVARFQVYNHNIFGNCTKIGTTSFGTPLYLNTEAVKCDFKIAIGSIVPHGFAGFGGGGKTIMPGIASFDTIKEFHSQKQNSENGSGIDFTGMGCLENNLLSQNIEEAVRLFRLDYKIDALLNMWGQTVSLYAGSPTAVYKAGVAEGRIHYQTPMAKECDIVVTNTFAKANEGEGGIITGFPSVKANGGDMVLICNAPEGHVTHYLLGNWGSISNENFRLQVKIPDNVDHLIVFNEYPDFSIKGYFSPQEKVVLVDRWDSVLEILGKKHGSTAKVAIYSSAEIQYCSDNE